MEFGLRKRIKACIIAFLSVVGAFCVITVLSFNFSMAAAAATVSDEVNFAETYRINSEIVVPKSPIYYNNKQYFSEIKVVYPDNSASILVSEKLLLTQNGKYEIIYYTMADGQYLSVSKVFYVSPATVSFSGDKSSYRYGSHSTYATEKQGLVINLAQGETMYYNNIINIADANGGKVFSMFATSSQEPMPDAAKIYITFTDIYDSSNYVQVVLKCVGDGSEDWSNNNTYCQAKASNQGDFVGLEARPTSPDAINVAGGTYVVQKNGKYGSPILFSLAGYLNSDYALGDLEYGIAFDMDSKRLYSVTENHRLLLTDLQSTLLYDSIWDGFTTGEVFMSISAGNYNSSSLGLVFTDIVGCDLQGEIVGDIPAPNIALDFDGYNQDELPDAIVGKRYPVAKARAYDAYCGELGYYVKAYYGYDSSNPTQVDVNNGYFTPTREGYYTLEYTAINSYGLQSVVTHKVRAVSSDNELNITINGKTTSGGVGNQIKVANSYALSNVNGKGKVVITASNIDGNPNAVYSIGEDLTFIPFYSGFYKITFAYSDYIFSKTEEYNLSVNTASGSPIIIDEPAFPDRFIIGKKYKIPVLSGYIFPNGVPQEKTCDIYVSEDGGARRKLSTPDYTVGNYESITIVYSIADGAKTKEKPFTIKTVGVSNGGEIDMVKYFYTDGIGTAEVTKESVDFSSDVDCTWNFINLLVAKKMEWRVRLVNGYSAFKYLDFYLTDAANPDEKVKITFSALGEYTKVEVNGKEKSLISKLFSSFVSTDLFVKYDDDFKLFSVNNETEIKIDDYQSGAHFEGFTSGQLKLGVGMSGVQGESKFALRKINGQNIRSLKTDKVAPVVYYTSLRGYKTIGNTVTFAPAMVGDVLDTYYSLKFSVKDESGNYVVSDDGIRLDGNEPYDRAYSYTLRAFGTFNVSYLAEDSNGNSTEYSYVIHCKDVTPPTVSLKSAQKQCSVGERIAIAAYDASDDNSGKNVTVYITVIKPDLTIERITDSFVATKQGVYTVSYLFYDELGNVSSASYDVNVI